MIHEIEKHILHKLMYSDKLTYNQMRDEAFVSNKFNYYLQKFIECDLIAKKDEFYSLTPRGIHYVSTLDGISLNQKKAPIICCFIVGVTGECILLNERRKQPFLGYVGIPGGKLDVGNTLLEQARFEFLDETGLTGDLELKVISNVITYDKGEVAHHVLGFTYIAKNLKGDLKTSHREGLNFFIDKKQLLSYKLYPDLPELIRCCFLDGIAHVNAKRYILNGEFTGIDFI